jgi:hypothetical protein
MAFSVNTLIPSVANQINIVCLDRVNQITKEKENDILTNDTSYSYMPVPLSPESWRMQMQYRSPIREVCFFTNYAPAAYTPPTANKLTNYAPAADIPSTANKPTTFLVVWIKLVMGLARLIRAGSVCDEASPPSHASENSFVPSSCSEGLFFSFTFCFRFPNPCVSVSVSYLVCSNPMSLLLCFFIFFRKK